MRLLLPAGVDGDPVDAFAPMPPAVASGDRPWVRVNMVASVDGATAVDGESRGLSGPADRVVFHRLRATTDVVMAGAATVRADRYGPGRADPSVRAQRVDRGQTPVPGIAVVTRSLDLDWDSPLFAEAEVPTVVLHPEGRTAPARIVPHAIAAGRDDVDFAAAVEELGRRGVRSILCEGGPGIVAQLTRAGVVDEVFLTVSPLLVCGDAHRVTDGPALEVPVAARPTGVMEKDGFVFLRYQVSPR